MSKDSKIEQQLRDDNELFLRMAEGVEDDVAEEDIEVTDTSEEVEVEETDDEVEVEEDGPTKELPDESEEDDDYEDEEEEEVTPPKKSKSTTKLYTPEEIKELLAKGDFSQIDTSRLSEEGKLVMKSMQSGLTPKLQEAAELRRKLEELDAKLDKAIPQAPPKDIYEAYDRDPEGVMKFVENKIDEAIDAGDERAEKKLTLTWQRLKEHGRDRALAPKPATEEVAVGVTMSKLIQEVPDIQTKQGDLRDFALSVMGYSEEELAEATSLARGDSAIREIVRINNAYTRYTAAQTAQNKAKRKRPTKVEKSGGGFEKQDTTTQDRIREAKKRAAAGDTQAFFDVFYHMED